MKSSITFLAADGTRTDIENAVSYVATEYDDDGETVSEVFGSIQ